MTIVSQLSVAFFQNIHLMLVTCLDVSYVIFSMKIDLL